MARLAGEAVQRYSASDGDLGNHVRDLHFTDDYTLLVAAEDRGVSRLSWSADVAEQPQMVSVRAAHGLLSDGIHQILPDGHGWLWMSTNLGIFRVRQRELLAAADPLGGGDPSALNLPSFLSQDCVARCEWQRTVKNIYSTALSFSTQINAAAALNVSVTPAQFTLAGGASQTLAIRAEALVGIAPEAVETVRIALRSSGLPDTLLSGALAGINGRIPNELRINGVGLTGAQTQRGLSLGALSVSNLGARVGGAVTGTVRAQTLIQDNDTNPFNGPTGVLTGLVPVAANAPALIAEVLSTTAADLDLFVGPDLNADGALQANEVLCTSASEAAIERCKVDAPAAGNWIVLLQNYTASAPGAADQIRLSYAALTRNPAGNLSAAAPAGIQAWTPFDLQVTWNFATQADNPPRYGFIEITEANQVRAGFALSIYPAAGPGLLFANGFE